jgi:hypothetical protein
MPVIVSRGTAVGSNARMGRRAINAQSIALARSFVVMSGASPTRLFIGFTGRKHQ